MKNIAVFVSGGGSNLQALIDRIKSGDIFGKIVAVIASKPGIKAIERAQMSGINSYVFQKSEHSTAQEMFEEINSLLKSLAVDLVVLAGYLTILPQSFVSGYKNRIINTHPSLIPAFCGDGCFGLNVHKQVLEYGCRVSGATVHFVDSGTDTGPIILQQPVSVLPGDSPESLQQRVLLAEHELLPQAVKLFCEDKLWVEGRTVIIKQ